MSKLKLLSVLCIAILVALGGHQTIGLAKLQQDTPPANSARVRVDGPAMAGNLVTKVDAVYPAEARRARVTGSVIMEVVVGKDGKVLDVAIVSGPEILQSSAAEAVKQWAYRPVNLNGQPVEVVTTVTVTFSFR